MRLTGRILHAGAMAILAVAPVGVAAAQRPPAIGPYPAWFLAPPVGTVAVMAPRYATVASSWQAARDSAAEALGRAQRVRVRVRQRAVQIDGVGLDLEPGGIEERTKVAPDSVFVLDSVLTASHAFILAAAVPRPVPPPAPLAPPSGSPPAWVTEPPAGLAGVGTAPLYVHEHGSWAEAEQRGRAALVSAQQVKARAATRLQDGEVLGVISSDVRADLTGARVVARWRDARSVYVLVQADRFQVAR